MSSTQHYPTLFIALLALLVLLVLPLIYPRSSFRFMMLFQVFTLGMQRYCSLLNSIKHLWDRRSDYEPLQSLFTLCCFIAL